MKLRNKKTGEIGKPAFVGVNYDITVLPDDKNKKAIYYNSLAELNEEWEDYEEPKEYWCIRENGVVGKRPYPIGIECVEQENREEMREIGNYFETKEEAEKAVEKLKAWKRLKDKGFGFTGIAGISNDIFVSFETDSKYSGGHIMYDEYNNTDNKLKEYNEDLMLLFGGEE